MTVIMYSIEPPTRHTSQYLLRPTILNGPRSEPLPKLRKQILDDIDEMYGQDDDLKDDGFLE